MLILLRWNCFRFPSSSPICEIIFSNHKEIKNLIPSKQFNLKNNTSGATLSPRFLYKILSTDNGAHGTVA